MVTCDDSVTGACALEASVVSCEVVVVRADTGTVFTDADFKLGVIGFDSSADSKADGDMLNVFPVVATV